MKGHLPRALAAVVLIAEALLVAGSATAAHTMFPPGSPFSSGADTFTGFASCANTGGAGPTGMIDDGSSFYVVDVCDQGSTYRFPVSGGDASSPSASSQNGYTHGLASQEGHYYGVAIGPPFSSLPNGVYEFDPATLAVTRTVIATAPENPLDVVADPASGDLFVTLAGDGILRIQDPAGSPSVGRFFFTTDELDGAAFTSGGSVLYAADPTTGHVLGFNRSAQIVFDVDVGLFHGPDGIAVASSNVFANIGGVPVDVSNDVFVNSNDGTIEMIDVHNGNAVSVVAAGGTRGDFATVGPDHCLYVTQSNTVEKMSPCFFEPTPDPPITGSGTPVSATEGNAFSGTVATFSDPDTLATAPEYSATINWGDGSPVDMTAVTSGGSGSFIVSGSHTYAEEGSYTVTTTITDDDNSRNTATASSPATVADAALSSVGRGFSSANPVGGVVAAFSDTDPNGSVSDYTAAIDWGDGGPTSPGTIAASDTGFSVSGNHMYAALGQYTVKTHTCDAGGSCTDATSHVVAFAYASSGSFVVGDLTVGPVSGAVGKSVYFWSSQWASKNSLSGGVAPAIFKGFEDDPAKPACGVGWTGQRKSTPPATIPTYMAVIVSSTIMTAAKSFSGNDVHVVIVKTDPGYGPKPNTPGTGTVASVVC